jgi:hypothetical protein
LARAPLAARARLNDSRTITDTIVCGHRAQSARGLRKFSEKFLDGNHGEVHGDFVMLIVRQPSRKAIRTAFAAYCTRLFGGSPDTDGVNCPSLDSTSMKSTAHQLEREIWRGG